jgi:glycosyltransferase involved in cell wall biosynthesis
LIFADYYLPSVGAGGGVRILANIVERFSDRYEFFVVARDHDSKTDRAAFKDIPHNEWTTTAPAQAYYFSRNRLSSEVTRRIVDHARPDLVFLNSLFSIGSIRYLWERRKGKFSDIPLIVSPCGEVLIDALRHKSLKKRTYIAAATIAGLHKNILWRATSEEEVRDLRPVIGNNEEIFVIPDLAPRSISLEKVPERAVKAVGSVDLVYVARIVGNKNLHFLLEVLNEVRGNVRLTIVGPHEDSQYWERCQALIRKLPQNVTIHTLGLLSHESVLGELAKAHVFVLPTQSENFGYSIIEALSMGCPIVISDRTPWNNLTGHEWAEILDLEGRSKWVRVIEKYSSMGRSEYTKLSEDALAFAKAWLASSSAEVKMEELFTRALTLRSTGNGE